MAIAAGDRDFTLRELEAPLRLDALTPAGVAWEVELGFGKGRYLLRRAAAAPDRGFLGLEVASEYFRRVRRAARRRGLANLVLIHGEALFLLCAVLPRRFAAAVHVYFPDPWPKSRHQKRRLFDAESVDLVVSLLAPGGRLFFATDHPDYGAAVAELLGAYPGLAVRRLAAWPEGPRTHYEARFSAAGSAILRLEAELEADAEPILHPQGAAGVLVAPRPPRPKTLATSSNGSGGPPWPPSGA